VSTLAQVTGGSAGKPFGTTIAGTGYAAANGLTASTACPTTDGCVVNVDASFNTSNAAYHPVKGKQNNWYAKDTNRIQAPWTGAARGATADITSWGYLITCWDCHAPNNATGVQTMTVTAHGGPQTLRQDVWVASTINNGAVGAGNLCIVCHKIAASGSQTHLTGSAWQTNGNNTPGSRARDSCFYCHASARTKPARPLPAQDAHGFDAFAYPMGTDKLWPVGATETYKPYAFMRNVGTGNTWVNAGEAWKPLSGPGVTAGAATCGSSSTPSGAGCGQSSTYTPGGMY
jgi:hypothetical protein